MDHQLIQLVARLKIRLRQQQGLLLNPQRFFADKDYQAQILDAAEESDDAELVAQSLDLRNRLGLITLPHTLPHPAVAAPPLAPRAAGNERYRFGARS